MVLGARQLGTHTLGDATRGLDEVPFVPDVTGTASLTFGTLTISGTGEVVKTGTASLTFGTLRFGTASSPGGGTAGGVVEARSYRELTLPFEYQPRWGDFYQEAGLTLEQAAVFERRDRELEEYLQRAMPDLIFSLPGLVYVSTSPKYRSRDTYRVDRWIASLNTAGTTTTTLWVKVSGVRRVEIELAAGVTEATVDRYVLLDKNVDYVQIEVATAGSSASDLSVQGILRH